MAASGWTDWLHDALEERHWDQAELSKRSGVDDALISKWLSGKVRPGLASIRSVCAALGVRPVEGMIAAGHLEPSDVGATVINQQRTTPRVSELHHDVLLADLARRLDEATAESRPEPRPEPNPDGMSDLLRALQAAVAADRAGSEEDEPESEALRGEAQDRIRRLLRGRLEGEQVAARRRKRSG
ncbi:helix-turn-helix domain-containing protein [Pseudonocardia sichuanensis]